MPSKQKMVYLDEIRPWKTAWLIEAKVLHTWKPSTTRKQRDPMPALGCKIHAACKKNYLKTLGEECKVGEWKKLYNFQVSAAGKHYRTTQHMYKITFINETVIKPSDFQNDDMFLSLAESDSVMSGKLDNDILIGNLQVSNSFDSSQLVFNPNIKEAKDLREAFKFNDDSMSIVETSEDGKHIVTQANSGTGQKLSNWKEYEDKKLSELLGCTQVEDPELLPECITDLVGKTYKFGVTIEKGAEIFKVLKVWSVYNTLMVDSQSETALERETIAISGSEVRTKLCAF
ncbi:hypothetical protein F2Q69_00006163 [Brassica cretica]|uniref:Replication protein A 70 kDa DNA-binding subunit B/D first OB fold domain-containing protein n=1 Tax=Brassica cretica TaxID=69181 RepID=A0A8S9P8J9_BRACR|nr:hypothetical protein F2Q69_00006163 [Brassica cretica]